MPNDNTLEEEQAMTERQQRNIKFYWAERGYVVKTTNYRISGNSARRTAFCVRSDMSSGLPKDWRG
jgi:dipeptidyl aminopeptidase/acylaminoacyl peptidase